MSCRTPCRFATLFVTVLGCLVWPLGAGAIDLVGSGAVVDVATQESLGQTGSLARKVGGVWTSYFINPVGVPVFTVYTFNGDGTSEGNNNIDEGDNFSGTIYSNIRGSWVRTGPRSIREVAWNFGFNTNGVHTDTWRYITDYEFDNHFTHADSLSTFELYATSASLADPDAEPIFVFADVPGTLDRWNIEAPDPLSTNNGRGIFKKAAGVWYIPPGEAFDAWVLFTINEDGTLEENSTLDGGGNPGAKIWSNGRGPLVKSDDNTAYGESVIMGFDLGTGVHSLNVKGEVLYTFNQAADMCDIVQVNKVYLATQDPLDPAEVPIFVTAPLLSTAYKWIITPPAPIAPAPVTEMTHLALAMSDGGAGLGLGRPLIPQIAGTWYSDEIFCLTPEGPCEQLIFTVNADGTVEGNSTADQGVLWGGVFDLNTVFSNTRAAIVQTGPLTAFDNGAIFGFDRATGEHTQTTRSNVFLTFDPGLETGMIAQVNEVFAPEQNIFDPAEVPGSVNPELTYPIYRLSAE